MEKICTRCNKSKLVSEFPKDKNRPDGVFPRCKECQRAYLKEYRTRADTKVKHKQVAKEWAKSNPEKRRESLAKYDAAHKIEKAEYYARNRERRQEYMREYQQNNPDKFKASRNRRRALKRDAKGTFSDKDIALLLTSQPLCVCGHEFKNNSHTIEHKMPLSRGGTNSPDNLMLLCLSCNVQKQAKTPDEFMAYLEDIGDVSKSSNYRRIVYG